MQTLEKYSYIEIMWLAMLGKFAEGRGFESPFNQPATGNSFCQPSRNWVHLLRGWEGQSNGRREMGYAFHMPCPRYGEPLILIALVATRLG